MHAIQARFLILIVLLFLGLCCALPAAAQTPGTQGAGAQERHIEALLKALEDPQQRDQLIQALRTLTEGGLESAPPEESTATVKTAAAELVELLAEKTADLTGSVSTLLYSAEQAPDLLSAWVQGLRDPATRERWLRIGGRLVAVLGVGFAAAAGAGWLIRRIRRRRAQRQVAQLLWRLWGLTGRLLLDLVPILVFAVAAYAVLTLLDPRAETRLVAIALINASVLSRLVIAVSAFLFAPEAPGLRLWQIADETAHYLHQWIRRLSVITIYGFYGLQAGLLLGLDPDSYEVLLRLLGLVVLALLLVLVAQNREDVARVIAPDVDTAEDTGEGARQLSALRRGVARVWHLLAGLYLVMVYAIWTLRVEDGAWFLLRATLVSLVVVAVARLLMHAADHLFERGLRLSGDLRARFPGLEQRLNRYFPALRRILKIVIGALALLLLLAAWGFDTLGWLTEGAGRALIVALINVATIVAVTIFLWELTSGGIERYLAETDSQGRVRARSARTRTLLTVARNALLVVLSLVSVLMVLSELGVNIAPLLAGAGVVGLAIGFGSQRLVQDVINGAFILFQDLMSVGDVVRLGDKAGVVEAVTIRTVRLRDLAGVVHTIPFSTIEGVSNLTREYSFHVFDLGIAYREDVDAVMELLHQIGEELRADPEIGPLVLEPLEVFGLDAFGDSAIMIKGRIKTQPIKQWQVGRAFNRLVKKRFDELGIEIPFPHRTLYFGQDKNGEAPPVFVELESLARAKADA